MPPCPYLQRGDNSSPLLTVHSSKEWCWGEGQDLCQARAGDPLGQAPPCPPFSRTSSLWHFLRSCSSRRYLRSSSWLLLFTSSMAWPIWWGMCCQGLAPQALLTRPLAPRQLLSASPTPQPDYFHHCHTSDFPKTPPGRYCSQAHFTEEETAPESNSKVAWQKSKKPGLHPHSTALAPDSNMTQRDPRSSSTPV